MTEQTSERPSLELDNKSEQGFCSTFKALPEKDPNTIRVFERSGGEFYSVHGEDALYIANIFYKTTTVLKYLGGPAGSNKSLPSCTLSRTNAEIFLRDALLKYNLKIEIWFQDSDKKSIPASYPWTLKINASPGNLQKVEDMLFSNTDISESSTIMAVQLKTSGSEKVLGVAYIDASQRTIGVCEFVDNDAYSLLESLIVQLSVKECLIQANENTKNHELSEIYKTILRCNTVATEAKRGMYDTSDLEQDLNRLLGEENSVATKHEFDLKASMSSVAALLKYLSLLSDDSNFGNYTLHEHKLSQFMKLDAAAVEALNLVPTNEDEKRQDLIQIFYDDMSIRDTLKNTHMRSVPDLRRMTKRFKSGKGSLQDMVRIYQVVIKLPALISALEDADTDTQLLQDIFIKPFKDCSEKLQKLQELVETTIDMEMLDRHEFIVKPDFDQNLQDIKQNMDRALNEMSDEHVKVADRLNLEEASRIRNKKAQYIELTTQKNGVYFTTPAFREFSQEYKDLSKSYEKAQSALVKEVLGIVNTYCPMLEIANGIFAHLDVICSLAEASATAPIPYVRPKITEGDQFILNESRHPCIEVQEGVSFIPNDVKMIRGKSEFEIITGPNMGGKSTYIRQIGAIALMAQVGCFVPCAEAEICIFDCVLARVGAGDAQLKGVSTFMAEMLEMSSILKTATRKSLIIVDELGRGTSTYDGFGLAWAISEHIITKLGSFCLFATHFHELTTLAKKYPGVHNLNVTAYIGPGMDAHSAYQTDYLTIVGVCEQSFGIHVAELANFPGSVVRLSKKKAEELEEFENKASGTPDKDTSIISKTQPSNSNKDSHPHSGSTIAKGNEFIEDFLREFASTPNLKTLSPESLTNRVDELLQKHSQTIQDNSWLREIIDTL
ncbi:MSH2 protein [Mycoemilia scoparia]|uniref:MSH2 protein n=1 Tax=Mycoemilia scoparia TaxID=417184 RepID=A0A9W8A8Z0_9FUNG|nr:MSH2 protein [Mycoemilia scoparia]